MCSVARMFLTNLHHSIYRAANVFRGATAAAPQRNTDTVIASECFGQRLAQVKRLLLYRTGLLVRAFFFVDGELMCFGRSHAGTTPPLHFSRSYLLLHVIAACMYAQLLKGVRVARLTICGGICCVFPCPDAPLPCCCRCRWSRCGGTAASSNRSTCRGASWKASRMPSLTFW